MEHNSAGQARAGTGGTEIDLLAAQILKRLNVVARQNVQFRDRQPDDVLNAAFKVRYLALGTEIFEHVGLCDGRIHSAKIKQVIEIRRRAIGHDRKNA